MQTFISDSHCTKKEHYGRFRAVKHDLLYENGSKCDHLEQILKALIYEVILTPILGWLQ